MSGCEFRALSSAQHPFHCFQLTGFQGRMLKTGPAQTQEAGELGEGVSNFLTIPCHPEVPPLGFPSKQDGMQTLLSLQKEFLAFSQETSPDYSTS